MKLLRALTPAWQTVLVLLVALLVCMVARVSAASALPSVPQSRRRAPATSRSQAAAKYPWSPEIRCALNPTNNNGLHPGALAALRGLEAAHRVTQGINHAAGPGNVHDTDGMFQGQPYTGAVDISVRCLTAAQIKTFLERLADVGFAAWYRKPGEDGWTGPPHIHAVWAGCSLKTVLQQQLRSWLDGKNGLSSNMPYQFWQPSAGLREKVDVMYRKSKER